MTMGFVRIGLGYYTKPPTAVKINQEHWNRTDKANSIFHQAFLVYY